ncbi:MAG: transglycosylase domain-containing protein [Anaerolineales bacterium]|nr:transglycosylase domain-containing protein [Anaerolineales bacterium]
MNIETSQMASSDRKELEDPSFETAAMDSAAKENPIDRFHRLVKSGNETEENLSDAEDSLPAGSPGQFPSETPQEPSQTLPDSEYTTGESQTTLAESPARMPFVRVESAAESAEEVLSASATLEKNLDDTSPRRPVRSPRIPEAQPNESIPLKRVPETDIEATRVSQSAYIPPSPPTNGRDSSAGSRADRMMGCTGCFIRMVILALFGLITIAIAIISWGLIQYSTIAAALPSVEDLKTRAAQFETTRILDREGNELYEILDPNAGRRTYVTLDDISPYMVAAVVATEDSQYYSHPGYDLWAIARAFWQNFTEDTIVSGASTITQQLTRTLLFDPEEAYRRDAMRKIREVLTAAQVTEQYSKDEILELFLNESNFGNHAYGVEAAAQTYFNTSADKLTLAQSAFLAGLVQAPSVYDIHTNREATLARLQTVLTLMVKTSDEQGCIYVSNSQHPICVSAEDAGAASVTIENYEFTPPSFPMRYPHWVNFIKTELEEMYDPQTIYRSGFTVYTTLDPDLQQQAQQIISNQINTLADRHVTNGALVAIHPSTGEILAMVGSADFYNEDIDGQINMSVRPRQPGSSMKPLTYTLAFEMGWTPATLIWDVPSEFPPSGNIEDTRPPYEPVNYDDRFHGPVTVRSALANSFNVPAVKALNFVRIYDNPDTTEEEGFIAFAQRMGIETLTRNDYGLSLTLGGGEVTLLDLTAAYSIYANNGTRIPPVSITRIEDFEGNIVYEYEQPDLEQVISAEHAYLITSILSDNQARAPMFGTDSMLYLPFAVAAKTGTTNDFRDNWTLGYTPDIAVGVWVGNADYTPMVDTSGLTGAAPIWNEFIQAAVADLTNNNPANFAIPLGIEEHVICSVSGAEPSKWCPSQRVEIFAAGQPPLEKSQDLWQQVYIDSWTRLLASADCAEYVEERLGLAVTDTWAQKWIREEAAGRDWAESVGFEDEDDIFFIPQDTCTNDNPRPVLEISSPAEGDTITMLPLVIEGKAAASEFFKRWTLSYGEGFDPQSWIRIKRSETAYHQTSDLASWDPETIPDGPITLRIVMQATNGGTIEKRIHLSFDVATPTPSPTPSPTETLTPSATSTPEPTTTASNTRTPTATGSPTNTRTLTPSPTATATPSP